MPIYADVTDDRAPVDVAVAAVPVAEPYDDDVVADRRTDI